MGKDITLIMTLVVKDEVDIVGANIDYHLARGVDRIIVTDNGSTDGTLDVIAPYVVNGKVKLLHEPTGEFRQSEWVSSMAEMAFLEYAADWVIHSDADEFWWPEVDDLKSILSAVPSHIGLLYVSRYDFLPPETSSRRFYEDMTLRETVSKNFYGRPLPPKILHRGRHGVYVISGNHGAICGELGGAEHSDSISVLHFPVRSYEQYEHKVIKGGEAYRKTFRCNKCIFPAKILPLIKRFVPRKIRRLMWSRYEAIGPFWFRLYEMYERGGLRDYYNNLGAQKSHLDIEIESGSVVVDERLKEFMRKLES